MGGSPTRAALLAVLLLGMAYVPHAGAQTGFRVIVNLKTAENAGCSDDVHYGWFGGVWYSPDLQARVWYDGQVVYETVERNDTTSADWYDLVEFSVSRLPATIELEVREGEPGPTPQTSTFVPCDIAPGGSERLTVTIPTSGALDIDSRGDGPNAARLVAKAGSALLPHPRPVPIAALAEPSCLKLTWSPSMADPGGVSQFLLLDRDHIEVSPEARAYDWCALAENSAHSARLRRSFDGWSVWMRDAQGFATTNAPPPAPTVNATDGLDELNVTWSVGGPDTMGVKIHCGPDDAFAPTPLNLCAEGAQSGRATVPYPPGEVHLAVVASDVHGATSLSRAIANVTQRPPPPAPTLFPPESLHTGVRLAWANVTTAGVAERVLRVWAEETLLHERRHPPTTAGETLDLPAGRYTVELQDVNANGLAGPASERSFEHIPPNVPPGIRLELDRRTFRVGEAVDPSISVADADGDALSLEIDWGDGERSASGPHAYATPGPRTLKVTVHDPLGATASDALDLVVEPNSAPVATLVVGPANATVGTAVHANVTLQDAEGDALTGLLDWGDGTTPQRVETSARHAYARAGNYTLRLLATDALGAETMVLASVRVVAPTPPPAPSTSSLRSVPGNGAPPTPEADATSDPAGEAGTGASEGTSDGSDGELPTDDAGARLDALDTTSTAPPPAEDASVGGDAPPADERKIPWLGAVELAFACLALVGGDLVLRRRRRR